MVKGRVGLLTLASNQSMNSALLLQSSTFRIEKIPPSFKSAIRSDKNEKNDSSLIIGLEIDQENIVTNLQEVIELIDLN